MSRTTLVRACLLAVCCVVALPAARAEVGVDTLAYQVSYRGIFSMGEEMLIADAALRTGPLAGNPAISEMRLEASSAAYGFVESLYPIRYRFRTWLLNDAGGVLGFETYEKSNKLRHRLYVRDASRKKGVRRFDLAAGAGVAELARLEKGELPSPATVSDRPVLDRLGLLQHVRAQDLRKGAGFSHRVTDGSDRLDYTVRVETSQVLTLDDIAVPAWKVRFDAEQLNKDGTREVAHRPVFIWLSKAGGHIPLRVDSRHAIGLFRLELKNHGALTHLASLSR